jgi:hypothetical protein
MCECGHELDTSDMYLSCCPFGGQWIVTHDAIWDVMYAFIQENGHTIWKKRWYALMSKISLWVDFYMTCKDQIFVDDVVVINPMWEMVAFSVISWLVGVATKLSTIAKIHKYKRLHEGHHFILMVMEVHGSPGRDMDHFIKECARLFHNRWSRSHLSLSFCIQFFKWHGNIAF